MKNLNINSKKTTKILIVQIGRIGDLILLFPVFEALKKQNPNYELHLLASRHNWQIAENYPFIDKIHIFKKGIDLLSLILKLRKEKFDVWLDPKEHYSGESRYLALLSSAKYKIGCEKKQFVFDYLLANTKVEDFNHVSYLNMLSLAPFGINAAIIPPKLYINKESEKAFQNFTFSNKIKEYYCVNLSGSDTKRNWPDENWIQFLEKIQTDIPNIIIVASPQEKQRAIEIAAKFPTVYCYETPFIVDVFSVIAGAKLVISPDTSIVHIAAGFAVPMLGIYQDYPLNFKKFAPLSPIYEVVFTKNDNMYISSILPHELLESYQIIKNRILNKI